MRDTTISPDDIRYPLEPIVRFPQLRESGYVRNRVTLSRWIKAGKFPRPLRLGDNSIGWRLSDLRRWLDERQKV